VVQVFSLGAVVAQALLVTMELLGNLEMVALVQLQQ
jgi:hypothetical protein